MSDAIVKYCPLCEAENDPYQSFCQRCDGDLLNVPTVARRKAEPLRAKSGQAERAEPVVATEPVVLAQPGPELGRQPGGSLPAGGEGETQPAGDRATQSVRATGAGVLRLELVENPTFAFAIEAGQTVGRSVTADVVLTGVPNLEFISRVHARFTCRRGQWYVQYIAEGNFIKVDDTEYSDDSEVALCDDSIVVLSLTAFRVKLG